MTALITYSSNILPLLLPPLPLPPPSPSSPSPSSPPPRFSQRSQFQALLPRQNIPNQTQERQLFSPQSALVSRDTTLPHPRSHHTAHSASHEPLSLETEARKYFESALRDRVHGLNPDHVDVCTNIAVDFITSEPLALNEYEVLWDGESPIFSKDIQSSITSRLETGIHKAEANVAHAAIVLRLMFLLIHHQNSEITRRVGRERALELYENETKKNRRDLHRQLSQGRHYFTLLREGGPGDVIRLSDRHNRRWVTECSTS